MNKKILEGDILTRRNIPLRRLPNDHLVTLLFGLGLGFTSIWSEWSPFHELSSPSTFLGSILGVIVISGLLFASLQLSHTIQHYSFPMGRLIRRVSGIVLILAFVGFVGAWVFDDGLKSLIFLGILAFFSWVLHSSPQIFLEGDILWRYHFSVERLAFNEMSQFSIRPKNTLAIICQRGFLHEFQFPSETDLMDVYEKINQYHLNKTTETNDTGDNQQQDLILLSLPKEPFSLLRRAIYLILLVFWSIFWVYLLLQSGQKLASLLTFSNVMIWLLGLWGVHLLSLFPPLFLPPHRAKILWLDWGKTQLIFLFLVIPSALVTVGLAGYHLVYAVFSIQQDFIPLREFFVNLFLFDLGLYVLLDPSVVLSWLAIGKKTLTLRYQPFRQCLPINAKTHIQKINDNLLISDDKENLYRLPSEYQKEDIESFL